jgi:PKD repeat protein
MRAIRLILVLMAMVSATGFAQQRNMTFEGNWGKAGFNIEKQNQQSMQVSYSVPEIMLTEVDINGEKMIEVGVPGIFLPNNEGAPNLPGTGRYIAIPKGAEVSMEIVDFRSQVIHDINVSPAPRIPKETENGIEYRKDATIYGQNILYPEHIATISAPALIRGVDVVMLGFTPFQYNPATRDLTVFTDIRIVLHYTGGNGVYSDKRLRSRWFDPLLQDMLLNPQVLPDVDYNKSKVNTDDVGYEYLIICPNAPEFQQWADTIRRFRSMQGIITGVKTLTQVGGNTTTAIENYINNAYNTWTIPPVAVLLLGDYGTNINNTLTSPIWNSYCVSDNIYGDVNNDDLPDIAMARITAQNAAQLQVMVKKFINYETSPPVDPNFYAHPITCLGWQTERWFQICSEVIRGFWANSLGKTPVRINEVYGGNPSVDPWSTASNTTTVINYFGPSNLNYIPSAPQTLGGWTGGNASQINAALNSGAFMLQHRDHGYELGWGEPSYSSSDISGLTNTKLSFIMSVNCLTGKYNYASEVFAEKFHRYTYNGVASGAVGLLAASEISYSFVNDAFVWGVYDNFWPSFMPTYGTNPASRGVLPAFGNSAGKYFLAQSSWPYNSGDKSVTNNLFHHHGDAFLSVYSEVPQNLSIAHSAVIYAGATSFSVTANTGALICLSMNGEILGTATGTGSPIVISIPGTQVPPNVIDIVVTKQNFFRYKAQIQVIAPSGPFVIKDVVTVNDVAGNNNSLIDFGEFDQLSIAMKNVGIAAASAVSVKLKTTDPFITITDSTESYGNIPANGVVTIPSGFSFNTAYNIPDGHVISFTVTATSGGNTWISYFSLTAHAPVLAFLSSTVSDPSGNNNGRMDPGETGALSVVIQNSGTASASPVNAILSTTSPYINITTPNISFGSVGAGSTAQQTFSITANAGTPAGTIANFTLSLNGPGGLNWMSSFTIVIGQIPILILNLDGNNNSATAIQNAINANGVSCELSSSIPANPGIYSSIFLCLGIYSNNHVLTAAEGTTLAAFVNAGGKMYLEGGDCWAYDAQTALQPLFKISGLADGSGDLGTMAGQTGTFTEGLSFTYSGDNNWIDRLGILSGSTAFNIFANTSPSYYTGIAYEGSNYKTIGVSHEFGGIAEGTGLNTKNELMRRYLEFLGLISLNITADFTASDTTILPGETVTFTSACTGNPTSFNWSFPGGTPSTSTLQNPVVVYNTPGDYDVTLNITKSTASASTTKTGYISVGFNAFSGQVSYDNVGITPMSNVLVKLKSGANTLMQTTTDNAGNYSFLAVPLGNYTLEASCTKAWGGVNSTDALLIMKHFVGMSYLTGLRIKAADVDNNTAINTMDALLTQRRSISMISSFPAGNWCFEKPTVSLNGIIQPVVNIKALCFGDVNGSYQLAAMNEPGISIETQGTFAADPNAETLLNLRSAQHADLGALTLFLDFPVEQFELIGLESPMGNNNLLYKLQDGVLGISWYAQHGAVVAAGDVLFTLKLKNIGVTNQSTALKLLMNNNAEAATPDGNPISNFMISCPEIVSVSLQEFTAYPNPFSNSLKIAFNLEKADDIQIAVIAADGRKVAHLPRKTYPAGFKTIDISLDHQCGPGVYILEFTRGNTTSRQQLIKK